MDPFSKLPPELRVQVLINAKSGRDLLSLLHASPVMFRQYRASDEIIRKGFLGPWLNKSLLRDAIAVVTCPESDTRDQCKDVELHLRRWGLKELPDSTENLLTFCAVGTYVRQLENYMADFVAKATSSYLPFAYLKVPGHSARYTHPETELKYLKDTSHTSAGLEQLTTTEWERLARGFLRHELLSKVLRVDQATRLQRFRHERYWAPLRQFENARPHPRDINMIECLQEYVSTLWGALNREIEANTLNRPNPPTDLPVPDYPDCSDLDGHQRGLFAPDSSRFYIYHRYSRRLAHRGLLFFDSIVQEANMAREPVVRCFLETGDCVE